MNLRLHDLLRFREEPEMILAQYAEVRRQAPLLYLLLMVSATGNAVAHGASSPRFLTIGLTGLLFAFSLLRLVTWVRSPDETGISIADARRQLRRTTVLSGLFSAAFLAWSLALDQYGNSFQHGQVALFITTTVIGCIFCLVALPQAALMMTLVSTVPYILYCALMGHALFIQLAANTAIVMIVMMRMLSNSFERFASQVDAQTRLAAKQAETERLNEENARLAHTDSLTGLPNRRFFLSRLEEMLEQRAASGARFAVGLVDLDRFKPINDTYGHAAGDRVLSEVARRLSGLAGKDLVVARLGGDEFGLLIGAEIDSLRELGQAVCDLLALPFQVDDLSVRLGCSAGFAVYPEAGTSAHELFDRSDYALYHAKNHRRGGCAVFSLDHETQIRSERAIESALQAADLSAELDIAFQPIVCPETHAVRGVEALGRWTSPTLGRVPPDQFIIAAERMGFIHNVTLALFRKALDCLPTLPDGIGMAFNLSAHDIASPETIARLVALIADRQVDPGRITFELTETAVMRDFDAAVRGIGTLRAMGSHVALDDFGTGYSSLGYLRRLPLDKIKIDRAFVADMHDSSGMNVVTAIVGLCHTLRLDCIIEGVETQTQLDQVRRLGAGLAQGYFFAQPMALPALLTWLRRQQIQAAEQPVAAPPLPAIRVRSPA